ncbi:MAG: hypothetical protein KF855_14845 [Acidobacteria bacterium]|nr:hypothetical protein [Acidobacteriota bacterium]
MIAYSPIMTFFGLVIITLIAFLISVTTAIAINGFYRTNFKTRLVSSIVVGTIACLLTQIILIATLGPLKWLNGEPMNFQTLLWRYSTIIALGAAIVSVVFWQAFWRFSLKSPEMT